MSQHKLWKTLRQNKHLGLCVIHSKNNNDELCDSLLNSTRCYKKSRSLLNIGHVIQYTHMKYNTDNNIIYNTDM